MTQMRSFHSLFKCFILVLLLQNLSFGQHRCGTHSEPDVQFEKWIQEKIRFKRTRLRTAGKAQLNVYRIPVVVHVIHNGEQIGEGSNLAESRIIQQIESINKDFRRLNDDRVNTPAIFDDLAADVHIEFVFAKQDPEGNPTNGITRKVGNREIYNVNNSSIRLLREEIYWPPADYLNIYSLDLSGFLGFANQPNSDILTDLNDPGIPIDGVLIDFEYLGINPLASQFSSFGRTLTHEIGHYLGLYHIWGNNGCANDDYVDDTPVQDTDNSNLGSPCTFPKEDPACTDEPEMFQNYMDYTDDFCMNLFTIGQRERMRIVLENSVNRASLLTSPGLVEPIGKFENDLSLTSIEAPIVTNDLSPSINLSIRNRGSESVTNLEINISKDDFFSTASFNVSELSTGASTSIFPELILDEGLNLFDFEVLSANGIADESDFKNLIGSFIYLDHSSVDIPTKVNFDQDNWIISSRTDTLWQRITSGDSSYLKANGFSGSIGSESWLISPILNSSEFESINVSFDASYGNRGTIDDFLMVKVSEDGGNSYSTIRSFSSTDLAFESTEFQWRADSRKWKKLEVEIPQEINLSSDLRLALTFLSGGGNDLFIDNINISNFTPRFNGTIEIFPNPSSGEELTNGFNYPTSENIIIQIMNSSGKLLYSDKFTGALNQSINIPSPNLSGLYFVKFTGTDFTQTKKVIVRR